MTGLESRREAILSNADAAGMLLESSTALRRIGIRARTWLMWLYALNAWRQPAHPNDARETTACPLANHPPPRPPRSNP